MRDFRPLGLSLLLLTVAVAAAMAGVSGWLVLRSPGLVQPDQWVTFLTFAPLAAIAFMFPITLSDGAIYNLSMAFSFAAGLRLPACLLFVLCVIAIVPGTLRERRPHKWLKALFNAANWTLASQLAATIVYVNGAGSMSGPVDAFWILVAIVVNVTIVTVLVNLAIALNTGIPLRNVDGWEARLLAVDGLIALIGALIALLSAIRPWAIVLTLIPLALPYWLFQGIHLVRLADVDAKTGLYNHRRFQNALIKELARCKINRNPLAVLFADLDYLREVNNTHGHLAGDTVLRQVATLLTEQTRPGDLVSRWGGEEFAMILPGADTQVATHIAERLCHAVAGHLFDIGSDQPLNCTVSIGVAVAPDHGWDPDVLVHRADLAVYQAKARGRNRVCLADHPAQPATLPRPPLQASA